MTMEMTSRDHDGEGRSKIVIEPPGEAVILAARHLDQNEGPARVGTVIDSETRGAINAVLRYVAKAHNAPRHGEARQDETAAAGMPEFQCACTVLFEADDRTRTIWNRYCKQHGENA
jgi:hypothetical protein